MHHPRERFSYFNKSLEQWEPCIEEFSVNLESAPAGDKEMVKMTTVHIAKGKSLNINFSIGFVQCIRTLMSIWEKQEAESQEWGKRMSLILSEEEEDD